jgi:hypothetical protein
MEFCSNLFDLSVRSSSFRYIRIKHSTDDQMHSVRQRMYVAASANTKSLSGRWVSINVFGRPRCEGDAANSRCYSPFECRVASIFCQFTCCSAVHGPIGWFRPILYSEVFYHHSALRHENYNRPGFVPFDDK